MAAAENPLARLADELDNATEFHGNSKYCEDALKTADRELDEKALNDLTMAQVDDGDMVARLCDLRGESQSLDKCLKAVLHKLIKWLDRDAHAKMHDRAIRKDCTRVEDSSGGRSSRQNLREPAASRKTVWHCLLRILHGFLP